MKIKHLLTAAMTVALVGCGQAPTLEVMTFTNNLTPEEIEAAKFTSEEANGLRRAMATFRNVGTIGRFEDKMIGNMIARGYDPVFAKNCFDQIKGFGEESFKKYGEDILSITAEFNKK